MVSLDFLSTHKTDHPKNYISISGHPDSQLDIFSFIRDLFNKLENFEICVKKNVGVYTGRTNKR